MAQRLNFTGRQKILRSDARIRIVKRDGDLSFLAMLQLADYKLDPSATVHIEAFRGASTLWKRFDFGRVRDVRPPQDCGLNEFGRPEGIRFRIKVTATDGNAGRLLAEADQIRPRLPDDDEEDRDSLIDVVPSPDLGAELWKLDFQSGSPQLLVNDRVEDWKELAREPEFRAFVTPMVMRQILTKMFIDEPDSRDDDDDGSWQIKWKRFAEDLPGVGECPEEDVEDWIDDAVRAFCVSASLLEKFLESRRKENG